MDPKLFEQMHGGTTHFPIALLIVSFLFDLAAFFVADEKKRGELRAAAFYCVILGALGSIGAVLSGLLIVNWNLWGQGNLLFHHYFVWPSFALLLGIAAWRIAVKDKASIAAMRGYMVVCAVASACMGAAGYFGGEILIGDNSSSAPPVAAAPGGAVVAVSVQQSHAVYMQSCARCHGAQGQGQIGPDLRNEDMSDTQIVAIINKGAPNAMPAFAGKLTPDQVTGLVAYIRTLKK